MHTYNDNLTAKLQSLQQQMYDTDDPQMTSINYSCIQLIIMLLIIIK